MSKIAKLHMQKVRELGCLICKQPASAHHIISKLPMRQGTRQHVIKPWRAFSKLPMRQGTILASVLSMEAISKLPMRQGTSN